MDYRMVLISHGKFAEGLKESLEMIVGEQDFVEAHGLAKGENPAEKIKEIKETMTESQQMIILSDIVGGSMHNAAMELLDNPNVKLVGGVNLSLAIQVALTKPFDNDEIDQQINESKQAFFRIELSNDVEEDDFFE